MHQHTTCLRKRNPELGQFRFYAMSVERNLFGSWSLVREWGRIDNRATGLRIDLHDSKESAEKSMQRKIQEKQKRGYR